MPGTKKLQFKSLHLGNQKKQSYLISEERDFPSFTDSTAQRRYLLCSTPRSGSNLLSDALHATGQAGDPLEYLNPNLMAAWLRAHPSFGNTLDIARYFSDLDARRTSPSGIFGAKTHYSQLAALWPGSAADQLDYLARFQAIVFVTRRDKVAQAVSFHRANQTQLWTSEDKRFLKAGDPRLAVQPRFDAAAIAKTLADVLAQEASWRALFAKAKCKWLEVVYEDVIADRPAQLKRLFDWVGLPPQTMPPAARIKRQSEERDPMISQFLGAIG
jgi:LPS sulfotransferase NodH